MSEDEEGWMDAEELFESVDSDLAKVTKRCSVCGATWTGSEPKHWAVKDPFFGVPIPCPESHAV